MFPENFVKLVKRRETPPSKKEQKREATQRKSVRELASKFKDGVPMGAAPAPPKKKENKKYCKVLFEYKKENEDELELNVGEIVEFHKQVEEGWWEGTMDGRHGVFPSNFVEMIEEEPPSPVVTEDNKVMTNSTGPGDNKDGEQFHTIKGKKVMGVGLGNIFGEGPIKLRSTGAGAKKEEPPVKETPKPSKPPEPEPVPAAAKREKPSLERAVVRFSYAAEQPDELSLLEGQVIRIIDKELEDEGWWKGEVGGKEGVFPDNFVELLPPEEPSKPKKPPPPSSSLKLNSQHPKLPEKGSMGDSDEKIKTLDTAPPPPSLKKPAVGPPPIGKKPSSQKFGDGALPPGSKPEPPPSSKPAGPVRGKEEHTDHHVNNGDSGGFDNLDTSGQKLTHLTANRAKGPKKRPPSTVQTLNDGEKDADMPEEGRINLVSSTDKPQSSLPSKDLKHSSHIEPSPVPQLKHPPAASHDYIRSAAPPAPAATVTSSSIHQPQRPPEPTTAPPSQASTVSNMQTNKLIEQLQKELYDLKDNSVSKSEFNVLRKEHENLKSDFDALRSQHSKKLRELMNEVDEEKKLRLSTQVEIERVKKLMAESNV